MPHHFSVVHRVEFSETDMAGIVHFSNYFRWMEKVEHALFRSLGMSVMQAYEGMEIAWPRVACSCEYFASARFEEEITLRMTITKIGQKSMTYEMEALKGETVLVKGKLTSACVLVADGTFKAIPIPPALRERLVAASGLESHHHK